MELTMETIELIADGCIALDRGDTINMAKQLLAELDAPKVWDNAPEWATRAWILWRNESRSREEWMDDSYTRELQKTRIDEIAEETAGHWEGGREALEKAIKSAIIQARKEWEAER